MTPHHALRRPGAATLAAAFATTLTLATLSCTEDHEARTRETRTRAAAPAATQARRLAPVRWDTLWQRGRAGEDTLLLMPLALAADSDRVYVLDAAGYRVVAFDAATGALHWVRGGKGGGPGEFTGPIAVAAARGGAVVADPGSARLTYLDASGAVTQEVTHPEFVQAHSLCPLADGSLLVATGARTPLALLTPDGRLARWLALPWRDLDDVPSLARQLRLAPTSDRRGCVVALSLGRGFALYTNGRFAAPRPYVEALELPEVQVERSRRTRTQRLADRQIAAYDVAAADGEIAMAFEGKTRLARRVIDVYDESSGAYVRSEVLGAPATAVARLRGRAFLLGERDGYPTLTALRTATPRPAARAAAP